ncbi:type II toxin-antitoxin system PemK/MazF family toxin [Listeria monocytogenes]
MFQPYSTLLFYLIITLFFSSFADYFDSIKYKLKLSSKSIQPRTYPLYVPLTGTTTTGKVLLDQLVTIDYNARKHQYVETVSDPLLTALLETVKVIFQKNERATN